MFTMKQVASFCGVPYATLYAAVRRGQIPETAQRVGRRRVYTQEEAERANRYFQVRRQLGTQALECSA